MKIVDVVTSRFVGRLKHEGDIFWEERLIRPVDIYPRFGAQGAEVFGHREVGNRELEIGGIFIEIMTDDGITGFAGPIGAPAGEVVASYVNNVLRPVLVGEDPLAMEKLWDMMYRFGVHGRKGEPMMAVSAVDCALWDIFGKYFRAPAYRLLGGPVREKVPAYASMLGYSVEPARAAARSVEMVSQGFGAMKWFLRRGPWDSTRGMEENVAVVKAIRDSVGYGVQLMVDCWMSWGVRYTIDIAKKLERYEVTWIEEPVMPDEIDGYAEIRKRVGIPIAGGEHEYTRWGFKALFEKEALDFSQPDIMWAGGISETAKICALGSVYGKPVIPHTGLMPSTLAILFSHPEHLTPIAEYLVKWNAVNQHFLKTKYRPENGFFKAPDVVGLGTDIDESKVIKREVIR